MIRQPAVAGSFYPANPVQLQAMVDRYLEEVKPTEKAPKAIIVPHAGYIYSGQIAASAYARLKSAAGLISRIVLIGPSHRVGFSGLAVCHADQFATPLGNIDIDTESRDQLLNLPFVDYLDQAHNLEHSLEVQLPFLQEMLGEFKLLPLVAGDANAEQVSQLLEKVWNGPETLIVISSDLSHYHNYATAKELDQQTTDNIQALQYEKLDFDSACGRVPISGLLAYARKHGLKVTNVDLRNSGDTAGDKSRVVGYGAYVIE
ncbi:AmmeMemoRadiSam system protein B [Methylomarinum sp. Ch1-1]|uniref:MEMO1 family protein Q9L42_004420 n=1 Tax=Methylomarinum roseum TaxID=3067653 RepID=A0AAU7NZV3_9GAMM|nr:AmmeMemoRadiSam system protein B [Methylomarinum sp. Ch1-1]MDP4522560.1 AmmeMemoRadiSam system protein B [Methylomarinum sp. Ch1-1]